LITFGVFVEKLVIYVSVILDDCKNGVTHEMFVVMAT